jgi:acyl-CoA reductase-like NAD-dependent aldehyde dehydrogenase
VHEAGYPAGSFNLLNGTGAVTGAAMSAHMDIDKVKRCSISDTMLIVRSLSLDQHPPEGRL